MLKSGGEDWIDLIRFPAARAEAVRAIRARVRRSDTALRISYSLQGDIGLIRVPSPTEPAIGFELWRHTCFETFLKIEGQTAYHEFNLAPSGQWTVYAFSGYRDGAPLADDTMRPHIEVRSTASNLELDAVIQLDRLSADYPRAALRLGLAAVVETADGLSYWALRHPADKPDFHDPEGFVLRMAPPRRE